jgi:hypothetical protein
MGGGGCGDTVPLPQIRICAVVLQLPVCSPYNTISSLAGWLVGWLPGCLPWVDFHGHVCLSCSGSYSVAIVYTPYIVYVCRMMVEV